MLSAETGFGKHVLAWEVDKRDGPFSCPECEGAVIVRKGLIKVHHFAHVPPFSCTYGTGESEAHRRCKYELFQALCADPAVKRCQVERGLDGVRPDVSFILNDRVAVAIEVQLSALDLQEIIRRTSRYADLDIALLWTPPLRHRLLEAYHLGEPHRPRIWEKWLHALYMGRVYYWSKGQTLWPVHFAKHKKWVEERDWYDSDGSSQSAGGYWKTMKSTRLLVPGPETNVTRDFRPMQRNDFDAGDLPLPPCRIMLDDHEHWW